MDNGQGWSPPPGGGMGGQPAPAQQQQQAPQQGHPQQGYYQQNQQAPQQQQQQFVGQQMPQGGGQQPDYAANPFAGINSGDQSGQRHPFLEDGDYKLKLSGIKLVTARGTGKVHYIIEGDITESNNPLRPPGMRVACFINMSQKDTAGGHCAAFVASVFGFEPQSLQKDSVNAPWNDQQTGQAMPWGYYLEMSVHDTQPWVGMDVGVNVLTITTKATGRDFSLHTWHPAASFMIPAQPAAPAAPQQNQQQNQQNQVPPPPHQQGAQGWGGQQQQQAPQQQQQAPQQQQQAPQQQQQQAPQQQQQAPQQQQQAPQQQQFQQPGPPQGGGWNPQQ